MNDVADIFAPEVLHPPVDLSVREWTLVIPGEPVAKGRPKLGTVNGHAMAFTPPKTRRYEDIVRQTAVREWNRPLLADVPIYLRATFARGIAASWPRKKREAALANTLRPTGRPDLDNMLKAITDGLNGVVYLDDALIVEITATKMYAAEPLVAVTLTW